MINYFMPPQITAQPSEAVRETPIMADDVIEPDPNDPATEPLQVEHSDDNLPKSQDNSPDTEEKASLHSMDTKQEGEIETRIQRPQRQRMPPKTLRYGKMGTPSCYSALSSYVRPQVWTQLTITSPFICMGCRLKDLFLP